MRSSIARPVVGLCLTLLCAACVGVSVLGAQGSGRKSGPRPTPAKTPASAKVAPAVAPAASVEEVPAEPVVAMLAGVVEDSVGAPIIDAEIAILGTSLRTRSGMGGTWRIGGVAPGPLLLSARRIGYNPHTQTVHVREGETKALDLTLSEVARQAYTLPPLYTFATPAPFRSFFQGGFHGRRLNYPGGTFFTREDLMLIKPFNTSDVFRTTPGFYALRDRRGQTQWVLRGALGSQNCPVRFFIDGSNIPLNGMSIDDLVQPGDVEGIEIYKGMSTVPAEFSGKSLQDDSRCGVVAIWTRVTR